MESIHAPGLNLSLPAYHCRQWNSWRIYASPVAKGLINYYLSVRLFWSVKFDTLGTVYRYVYSNIAWFVRCRHKIHLITTLVLYTVTYSFTWFARWRHKNNHLKINIHSTGGLLCWSHSHVLRYRFENLESLTTRRLLYLSISSTTVLGKMLNSSVTVIRLSMTLNLRGATREVILWVLLAAIFAPHLFFWGLTWPAVYVVSLRSGSVGCILYKL